MSSTTNAHAELPNQGNYSNVVCCGGVSGLGNSCSGIFATVLKLSGSTNTHVEQNTQLNYPTSTCLSVPLGGAALVGYQANDCAGFDTTLGSVSGLSNAHVGNGNAYPTKICGTASAASVVSVTLTSDGVVSYGTLSAGASTSTISSQLNDTQIAKNDGDSAEDLNIRGQNSANWTLGATSGNNQYVHKFCTANCVNPPANFLALTTSYQVFINNLAVNGTQVFDLQITTPNPSNIFTQQSVDVMIQAVLH
ncbi:hypothetical protein EXS71_03940 [Candidatus Uhrbacteria bacterium]|nr:hypothetical protein [Candidatus Uhrbacteria bacterium]